MFQTRGPKKPDRILFTHYAAKIKLKLFSSYMSLTLERTGKKPECCNSKEGMARYERTQKKQAVSRIVPGAHDWPFPSSQDHIRVGSIRAHGPCSKLLKAKSTLRKKG